MLVPVVLVDRTSPSPANVPPLTAIVAPASVVLSGSDTVTAPDRVAAAPPSVKLAEVATLLRVGGLLTPVRLTVVVAAALTLLVEPPSLTTQVTVRVGLARKLVGLLLDDEKVTASSTCW